MIPFIQIILLAFALAGCASPMQDAHYRETRWALHFNNQTCADYDLNWLECQILSK